MLFDIQNALAVFMSQQTCFTTHTLSACVTFTSQQNCFMTRELFVWVNFISHYTSHDSFSFPCCSAQTMHHESPQSQRGAEVAMLFDIQNALRTTEALLDQQTNRGLQSAKSLVRLAEDLSQSLTGQCSPQFANHVMHIREELLQHADVVLGVLYSVRTLPKTWHPWAVPCMSTMC